MATPLERQLAITLGVEEQQFWPRLPMEVGGCEQGPRCCWRWLARAALEEVAGEPLGHMGLAEMVAKLKEEVHAASEYRKWASSVERELEKAAVWKRERDEFRSELTETQQELKEIKVKDADLVRLRSDCEKLQEDLTESRKNEVRLQREIVTLRSQKQVLVDGDLVAARKRAEAAEVEISLHIRSREEVRSACDALKGQLEVAQRELQQERAVTVRLGQDLDNVLRRRQKTRKSPRPGSPGRPKRR